jgi:hypothetical protein
MIAWGKNSAATMRTKFLTTLVETGVGILIGALALALLITVAMQ